MIVDKVIGLLMRGYRKSPLYPRLGEPLAKLLSLLTQGRPTRSIQHEVNGIRFELDLSQVIDASLYYSGTFEALAERVIAGSIKRGMTAIDVGANFGYHTLAMARLAGSEGKVIAIEPTTWAYAKLIRNASLNNFTNIEFMQVGLSDREEGIIDTCFQSSYRLDGKVATHQEKILITTLDAIVHQAGRSRVDFIKLDVDGFEGKVLRGAKALLKRDHPIVLFEISPSAMAKHDDSAVALIGTLQELGYAFQSEGGASIPDPISHLSKIRAGFSENLLAKPS